MKVALDTGAVMPTRAHRLDAGLDLYCRKDDEMAVLMPQSSHIFDTGVHVQIPAGYVGLLLSKSGLNVKHGITSEGVIDTGYTGAIMVKLYNNSDEPYVIKPGEKITQLVIVPCALFDTELVPYLEETERGENGFGSTGK